LGHVQKRTEGVRPFELLSQHMQELNSVHIRQRGRYRHHVSSDAVLCCGSM
jgi:hypothetical protein